MRHYYAIRLCTGFKGRFCTLNSSKRYLFGQTPPQCCLRWRDWSRPRARAIGCRGFQGTDDMKIHVGFDMAFECPQPTPMIFMVNVHPSRAADLVTSDSLRTTPARSITTYIDGFGNKCTRLLAPAGELRVTSDAIVEDGGLPD